MNRLFHFTLVLTGMLAVSQPALAAPPAPAAIFSDHMVLQRDAKVPVWGTASPGAEVTVSFAGQTVKGQAGKDGAWRVELAPLKASAEPQIMTVNAADSDNAVEIQDVLVGEVWVGSGQSNMAGRVSAYAKNDETLAALVAASPYKDIRLTAGGPKPAWSKATPQAINSFSALLFAFGERLHQELDVPVGLILGAVGGTPSGAWTPQDTFAGSKKIRAEIDQALANYDEAKAQADYQNLLARVEARIKAAEAKGEKLNIRKPQPPVKPGEPSRGRAIGGLYNTYISASEGYAIRGVLWDQGEARSGVEGVDQYTMMSELIRGWREHWGQGEFPFLFVQKPSGGGCAWSDSDPITRNAEKFTPLPSVTNIGGGDTNFLYVRLMRDNPNAWMVQAGDLGRGIHPTNKWGYGNRAAAVAMQKVYESGKQAYGPRYESHKVEGNKVIVKFSEVGQGLAAAHIDKLQGFALAGADGQWHWADAAIDGDTVVLTAKDVPQPQQVRYGWAQSHPWANLFNKDGLPAMVFEAGE